MRLPYLKIEYQEDESYALGKISIPLVLGFGLYWTYLFCFVLNGNSLFFAGDADVSVISFQTSTLSFIVVILAYGLFLDFVRGLFSTAGKRHRNRTLATISLTLGMAIALLAGVIPEAAVFIAALSGVLSGFGSAVLLMSFGVSSSVCDVPDVSVSTAFALFIGVVLFLFVMLAESCIPKAGTLLCLLLPAAQMVCLNRCSRTLVDKLEFSSFTAPVKLFPFALRICAPAVLFGVMIGTVRTYSIHMPLPPVQYLGNNGIAIAAAGAFTFVAVTTAMLAKHQDKLFGFRTLIPLSALLVVLTFLPGVIDSAIMTFALFSIYLLLEACMWIFFSDISQSYRISAFTVFGFGRAFSAIGTAVGYWISTTYRIGPDTVTFALIALVCFTLGVGSLPSARELISTLTGEHKQLSPDDIDMLPEAIDEVGREYDARAIAAVADLADRPTEAGDESDSAWMPKKQTDAESEEESGHKMGWFKRKCLVVADHYLLSRRETEVLFLLAKGRSSTTIQENLFISEGTANTHMRHIYRKLDVHSQRELIDLVESVELDKE